MAMTEVHKACVAQHEETGQEFTLNGNPDLTVQFRLETDAEGNLGLTGSFDGSIGWETEGRRGGCDVQMTFTGSGNQSTGVGSSTVSGSVCGVSVDEVVAVG